MNPLPLFFFSCDWGTSSFRLRLVQAQDGAILEETASACGVKALASQGAHRSAPGDRARLFHDYLSGQIEAMAVRHPGSARNAPVVVSGMASSSVGWREVPYAAVPFLVDGSKARVAQLDLGQTESGAHPVLLVSGLATASDMMRGEETELVGIFVLPKLAALARACRVVLPGTHSKHITVARGEIVDFHTYMTGELFQVLTEHSVLRFTTEAADQPWSFPAFQEGVVAARDSGWSRSLFQARSKAVLDNRPAQENRSFLSGVLIGAELFELQKLNDATPIVLAAAGALGPLYQRAGECLGLGRQMQCLDADQMRQVTVLGHRQLLKHLGG